MALNDDTVCQSHRQKKRGKERLVAIPKRGLTDRGLFRLLRPVRHCQPSNNALSLRRESTKQQKASPDWGKLGKGESLGSRGGAVRECRGRLTHSNWAPAATNDDVPRCAHHFQRGGGKLSFQEHAGGVEPQPRHFQQSFHTSLRHENRSERKTVRQLGGGDQKGGVGTAAEHPSSDPADSTLRTNLKLRPAG